MRIEIKGPITAERLAEVLERAAARHGETFKGFYGANLDLEAFNNDGEQFTLVNQWGDEVTLCMEVPDGEIARPALSEAGKARRAAREQERAEEEERDRIARQKMEEERARQRAEQRHQEAKLQAINDTSRRLLETMPESYISALNGAIRGVWEEMKPVAPRGMDKGQPRAMPWFECREGVLLLHSSATGTQFVRVRNPILKRAGDYHWQHEAWKEAARRMAEVLDNLRKELPPN